MKNRLTVPAARENLPIVQSFINEQLDGVDRPVKTDIQIAVCVEEIFVNIASYAYPDKTGEAVIVAELTDQPPAVTIVFMDSGLPYDPLEKADPDITLSVGERPVGGLGVFMVKKLMDGVSYEYRDGFNILRIRKLLGKQ